MIDLLYIKNNIGEIMKNIFLESTPKIDGHCEGAKRPKQSPKVKIKTRLLRQKTSRNDVHLRFLRWLVAIFFLTTYGIAQHSIDTAAQQIVQNELAFSQMAVQKGTRTAFLEFLSNDCLMFNPLPVNGMKLYRSLVERKGILCWKPTYVEISASGDFGISTGPWEYRRESIGDTAVWYGHFFSIWKKESDSKWKVILDDGHSYEKSEMKNEELSIVIPKNIVVNKNLFSDEERASLLETENLFCKTIQESGTESGLVKYSSENIRMYRANMFPVKGRQNAIKNIKQDKSSIIYHPLAAQISSACDLGFTYGFAISSEKDTSSFVRVWRKEKEWKIAFDILGSFKK
jgi:ketosteroid isomerase-like protein